MGFIRCSSLVLEHRFNSCGAWDLFSCGMWGLCGPGMEPVSPVLASGFFTTEPAQKPSVADKSMDEILV